MPAFDRKSLVVLALVLVAGFLAIRPAPAQIPDTFTNLTVLPKDIEKGELVGIMRSFSGALGQRCVFCHVPGPDSLSLDGMDFASDDKEHKRIARVMMKMAGDINATLAASDIENPVQVRCITCHHGVAKPQTIENLMLEVAAAEGLPAARTRYRELREEYYGQAAYDFSEGPLHDVAETLARDHEDVDGAISIEEMNLELNGESAYSYIMLGQLQARKGDKEQAVASINKALELEPDNGYAKRVLEQLKSGN